MVYFGIWLVGMKVFDLLPVTSAQVVGCLMLAHWVLNVIRECDFWGGGDNDYKADINQPFNFGRTARSLDSADDDEWDDHYLQSMEDDRIAQLADHEYWVWENPYLEELERDGKD